MPRRGLPVTLRMRHDEHYVEALASSAGMPIGRLAPIDRIDPNPNQPRQLMGDLSELMASIAEKGVIEPLVVRQRGDRYQIIAGERRYQAAMQVGLRELPVVIRDVDDTEIIELALIENLQRKDLTPFEEAEAMHSLIKRTGYTHESLANRLGKSRTAITESLSLHGMPEEIKNLCRLADISSKSLLLQVVRQSDPAKMAALIEKIASQGGATRAEVRQATAKPKVGRPKAFVFKYRPTSKAFQLKLQFTKGQVAREEIIRALESIIAELRANRISDRSVNFQTGAAGLSPDPSSTFYRWRGSGRSDHAAWRDRLRRARYPLGLIISLMLTLTRESPLSVKWQTRHQQIPTA